ncbi:MAG: hypothetical protein D6797_03230 [Bdellovibrio sp.]|nr:MAG: hypothetical protein D6797_03230 [Bdellovibrio sp.]
MTKCFIFLALFLLACTDQRPSGFATSSSTSRAFFRTPQANPSSPNSPQGPVATCNKYESPDWSLKIHSFFDPATLAPVPTTIALFLKPPQSLLRGETYIQIYRWFEDIPGQEQLNPQPVKIVFATQGAFSLGGGPLNATQPLTALSKDSINKAIKDYNLSVFNISLENFFQKMALFMLEMDLRYKAIRVALYNSQTNQPVQIVNLLLPDFLANPDIFASQNTPHLQSIHPFNHLRGSGATNEQYRSYAQELCQISFLAHLTASSKRLPASLSPSSKTSPHFLIRLKAHLIDFWNRFLIFLKRLF